MTLRQHGITVRDAAMAIGVTEGRMRVWLHRYEIARTVDGGVDPDSLRVWWDKHSLKPSFRRGHREPKNQAPNPYEHPDSPYARLARTPVHL